MPKNEIVLTLKGKLDQKTETFGITPSAGASIELRLDDVRSKLSVDYRDPDKLVLRVEGKIGLLKSSGLTVTAGADVKRDLFKEATTFDGKLELEIRKNIAAEIETRLGSGDKSVKAGVQIRFGLEGKK